MPRPSVAFDDPSTPGAVGGGADPAAGAASLIVDVEGAISQPGLWRLPAGSRVGDAIAAAGGYSGQVDIDAASVQLNLAAPLADGQQIRVPLRGAVAPSTGAGTPGGLPAASPAGSLIDVNSADSTELESLPGIGPVTAAKIISARAQAPFVSIDDLQQRGVVGAATLEKIRPLITAGP
jgi:competence protein ComEA